MTQDSAQVAVLAGGAIEASGIPEAARFHPGVKFDPVAATNAYLATLPPSDRARSDAYFEGGYWIGLWSFLIGAAILVLLLRTGWSRKMRDRAERITQLRPLQTFLYWIQFSLALSLLTFPWSLYVNFVREHEYGLATQDFAGWMGDEIKALLVSLVFGGLAVVVLYGVVRRWPRTWHVWGAIVGIAFIVFTVLVTPVFITPLFNKVTPLTDARVREPVLSLARANGIPAENVYVIDASRQSKRISANVSGLLGTTRINLNDNLLNRTSLPEIESVVGHEIGHYAMHHAYRIITFYVIVIVISFAFMKWAFARAHGRWGAQWGIRDIGDTAGLPLLALILSIFFFVTSPVLVNFTRTIESEADIFGLNASRQPDGFAQASLKLAEYRKLDPGPLEEWLFYDHPSGRQRILMSMRWKAEHEADYTSSQMRR